MENLARRCNLKHKIDWDRAQGDNEYHEKWMHALTRCDAILGRIESIEQTKDLLKIDPRTFVNVQGILDTIDKNVHEDYDFTHIEQLIGIDITPPGSPPGSPPGKPPVPPPFVAHIVDVDYENLPTGAHIFLYTRDLSNVTRLVTVPFLDYFYIRITPGYPVGAIRKAIGSYEWYLREKKYPEAPRAPGTSDRRKHFSSIRTGEGSPALVARYEVVSDHKSVYGYQPVAQSFLKVYTRYPSVSVDLFNGLSKKYPDMEFFEVKTDYMNKFLTKHGLSACVGVSVGEHAVVRPVNALSHCDYHVEATEEDISVAPGDFAPYVPRYMFWDIECLSAAPDGSTFPDANQNCPVIQISYLTAVGSEEVGRGVLCLLDTPGEFFESYGREDQMLVRFAQMIRQFNPDALVGYNSNAFDMPYVVDRMKRLGIHDWASVFTRRRGFRLDYKKIVKQSNQFGSRDMYQYTSPGLLMMDQLEILRGDATKRLDSYTLKHVCSLYLGDGDGKLDLRYRDIPGLFKTREGRVKIAEYCLRDGEVLLGLEKAVMFGVNLQAMARVLGTTTNVVATRGLVYKLMSKVKQYTERYNFLIPTFNDQQRPVFHGKYQGAFVLDPEVGYHEDPTVVLDYASLYPSLMIYYNLSWDSRVLDEEWAAANPTKCERMDNGVTFVTTDTHLGILARLEQELGVERKIAKKKKAAAAGGSVEEAIWDSTQNAVKIIMNSLYGMLGSPTASVPMVEVAATITAMGRYNLLNAKKYVEANYCAFTGEPAENAARVIYGDTDSIFIKMPGITIAKSIEYGKLLEKNITRDLYNKPNALVMEYEKVLCPLLLVTAKRYASKKYEFDPNKGKINFMGLQLVKRDAPLICKTTMKEFFERAIMQADKQQAGKYVEDQITRLMTDKMSLDNFKITKKISKRFQDYTTVPPHIIAHQRMIERIGPAEAPSVGEGFEFVITRIDKKSKGMSHAMVDYMYAEENGLGKDIDKTHYLRTFVDNPLRLPMELILGKSETTRILNPSNYQRVETVKASKGNLLGFFGVTSRTVTTGAKRNWNGDGITGGNQKKNKK